MTSAQSLWSKLEARRPEILRRAEEASKLTLPYVFPEQGHSESQHLPTPYQSIGAMGVNNLASKLSLTLFPPTNPFFRFAVEDAELLELAEEAAAGSKAEIRQQLSALEQAAQVSLEKLGLKPMLWESLVHMLITGNGCILLPTAGAPNFFNLRRYVVDRDPDDRVSTLIIKEAMPKEQLQPELLALLGETPDGGMPSNPMGQDSTVNIYTVSQRHDEGSKVMYKTWQEIGNGVIIPESQKEYTEETWPFIVLRFTSVRGEHYGRGLVEQYAGDLISAESLSQSLSDLGSAAARVVYLIRPDSAITPQRWVDAENGEALTGAEGDVSLAQPNISNAISVLATQLQDISFRLRQVFLMQSTRQAERVTAEEIRLVAQELQDTLGGTFSLMSEELQLPLVRLILARMRFEGNFPDLPDGLVEPKVVTGIEGLGRNQDSNRLLLFWQDVASTLGPEAALQHLNVPEVIASFAASRGVDSKLVKSQEEVAQEQEAAQQQAMAQQAVGPGIQAAAQIAQQ